MTSREAGQAPQHAYVSMAALVLSKARFVGTAARGGLVGSEPYAAGEFGDMVHSVLGELFVGVLFVGGIVIALTFVISRGGPGPATPPVRTSPLADLEKLPRTPAPDPARSGPTVGSLLDEGRIASALWLRLRRRVRSAQGRCDWIVYSNKDGLLRRARTQQHAVRWTRQHMAAYRDSGPLLITNVEEVNPELLGLQPLFPLPGQPDVLVPR